ncbi:MAG: zinc ribbon domain-containing protein [Abditibacteriales bacterium]|nr:zinc ribbon domain-containing protein [Abditibacteriales bacterium]MDW8367175.1 zinc ribbon domain-containing protein [Abditibacteriales bacterium]
MPIYEFRCQECETQFEELVSLHNGQEVACPHCGGTSVKRLMSSFASRIKAGSGGAPIVRSGGGGHGGG